MKFYVSSSLSAKRGLSDVVRELHALGFRGIELTGNIAFEPEIEEHVVRLKSELGLDFMLHNYFPPGPDAFVLNLGSTDPGISRLTIEHVRKAVRLSDRLGNSIYGMHPAFTHDLLPVLREGFFIKASDRPNPKEAFYGTVRDIARDILPAGFRLALETLHPKSREEPYSYLSAPEDIRAFLAEFPDEPSVGLLVDMGHVNVAAARFGFDRDVFVDELFSVYAGKIFEVHVSGNDASDDMHRVNETGCWQPLCLARHRAGLSETAVVFEWARSATAATFERYCELRAVIEG